MTSLNRINGVLLGVLLTLIPEVFCDFFYMKSEKVCGTSRCQREDYFHYYNCNGNFCDFHLQPWVFAIVSFIVLSFLFTLFCSLLKCICCPNRR